MTGKLMSHTVFPSVFGTFGLIWAHTPQGPVIHRIFLPTLPQRLKDLITDMFPLSSPDSCLSIQKLGGEIQEFLKGTSVSFNLTRVALHGCTPFQQRVLRAEFMVPRGWVTTYGRLAAHLGLPHSARAVGWALSHNPFPLVIPCHRTIRSTGDIGGFGGEFRGGETGRFLKQALLSLEGHRFSSPKKIISPPLYY